MPTARLVLISRSLLVDDAGRPRELAVAQAARLHRAGWRLMVLAPRPERWRPTRRSMDEIMGVQRALHKALTGVGGDLDGVCYLDFGLFTLRRSRARGLDDLAARYNLKSSDLVLITRVKRELELLVLSGARVLAVGPEPPATANIEYHKRFSAAVDSLIEDSAG